MKEVRPVTPPLAPAQAGSTEPARRDSAVIDLKLESITRIFGEVPAVVDMSFAAHTGEFISFLGPSGCGKTTTLSMIAGFLEPTSGTIEIRGRRVESLPPEKRNTGMVFQNYALFPHMSVAENVSFGLRMRHIRKDQVRSSVVDALAMVQMADFADRRPLQLSGGQQQRVALARALVIRPDVLLLDEPFGALDRQLREGMQLELKALQKSVGITTVFVTHDQEEALSMSDRVVVMNKGHIEQVGTPFEIYERPATTFVARFVGKSNVIPGVVADGETGLVIDTPMGRIKLPPRRDRIAAGRNVECIVRPEKMRIVEGEIPADGNCCAQGMIRQHAYQGATLELHFSVGSIPVTVATHAQNSVPLGQTNSEAWIAWPPQDTLVFLDGKRCL